MSIRLRLTLWYVLLLAVILVTFSGALYTILSYSLRDEVDRTLETRAAEVQNGADAALQVQSDIRGLLARGRLFLPGADVFATPGIYVQITGPDGIALSRSVNLGDQVLDIPSAVMDRAKQGDTTLTTLTTAQVPLRAFVAPLNARSQIVGVIVVAQSLQSVNDTLQRLATLLGFGIVGGLAFAAVVGALLARGALAPIDQMTQSARGIASAGDLTRRIDPPK
ncbi:MAG TPA: hypothetical protein VF429_03880, partial [Anaerolineae bacterium]